MALIVKALSYFRAVWLLHYSGGSVALGENDLPFEALSSGILRLSLQKLCGGCLQYNDLYGL